MALTIPTSHRMIAKTFLLLATICLVSSESFPANEYEYSVRRDWMMEAEKNYSPFRPPDLNEDEQVVDHYLQYLKWREFQATKNSAIGFPPSRPIQEKLQDIQNSEIYKALKKMPKGGNMHSHEEHEVSKKTLFDIMWASDDFKYLYLGNPANPSTAWTLDFFAIEPDNTGDPKPWIKVQGSNYTKEFLLQYNTLIGLLTVNATRYPSESGIRWSLIDPLWGRASVQTMNNINVKFKYLQAMYDHGISEGVTYIESRMNFGPSERLYRLDPDPKYKDTNGKVYLGTSWQDSSDLDVQMVMDLAKNYSAKTPDFIGHKRISYSFRQNSYEDWRLEMENTARLYNKYPDHVIGFDTVGQEDAGYATLHYLQQFLMLYDKPSGQSRVPLYLHVAETNWPEDLIPSNLADDPVSTLNNAYDVLLLNAKRLGHATAFIKHPYLLEQVRKRGIAIEICVISNQILGFTPDIRNHPGLHYYRSGIPIIFGADDPGTFGYDDFTVDWYAAYMAWGINLADLKQIAYNSLNYSGLNTADKQVAIEQKWRPYWNRYIGDMKAAACARNYASEGQTENRSPSFARILPREGARVAGTRVHVFGKNFERAICKEKDLRCKFGDKETSNVIYVSNEHIICITPDSDLQEGSSKSVDLSIKLDGVNYIPTNFNFTFVHNVITTTTPASSNVNGASWASANLLILIVAIFFRLFVC